MKKSGFNILLRWFNTLSLNNETKSQGCPSLAGIFWGAYLGCALLFSSCTSGRDLGYVYGKMEPAYYPKRFHIPGIIDIQKNSKRTKL